MSRTTTVTTIRKYDLEGRLVEETVTEAVEESFPLPTEPRPPRGPNTWPYGTSPDERASATIHGATSIMEATA